VPDFQETMMDRNTLIGLLLIGAILIGFSIYNSPSKEQLAAAKRKNDSIAAVQEIDKKSKVQEAIAAEIFKEIADTLTNDSILEVQKQQVYGPFVRAAAGEEKNAVIENEVLKITLSNQGGRIRTVELKKYKDFKGNPLVIGDRDSSVFGLSLIAGNRVVSTDSLFFSPIEPGFSLKGKEKKSFTMRMSLANNQWVDFIYTIKGDSYLLDFDIRFQGMNDVLPANINGLSLNWNMSALQQEKSKENEANATTIYYQFSDNEVDYLSEREDDQESIQNNLKWVAFKQQYFTSVIIAKDKWEKPTDLETKNLEGSKRFTKKLSAVLTVPFSHKTTETASYHLYYGPNHFHTLKDAGFNLEQQIPLGWGILGWINRFCVIPVFNFFEGFDLNYGIIILILTIIIKLVLFPLTYKAYLSSAKMKILKPEMDEINAKYANEDPMKKQQAIMGLYRQAGVNPLGGCLPMLLQLPILFAMFKFFPASIELRQESFLWATDLSTYDSIYDFSFNIPFYGDHVSLFTLLMTVSTILYTRMNSSQFSGPQMAQMKIVMYLMPVVFLGVFNNYSAGLSYYYFLANMITFGQQFLIRKFVDEDAIHRKIQENKKRPVSQTKSKFQARLEEMQKQQKMLQQQRQNKGKKK
jgi:YidC/Oxa1 family membrane protein insertase